MFFHLRVPGYFGFFSSFSFFPLGTVFRNASSLAALEPVGLWLLKAWGKQSADCGPPGLAHPGALQTAEKTHPVIWRSNFESN